jgi:lipid II:glycine glycyltransferase (peptidoglycan interpeptide bridge formation enzyme)
MGTNDTKITRELHKIRAHLLHYESLLQDFHKSVAFVLATRNPAMESDGISPDQKARDRKLLEKESKNLQIEIERLQMSRSMQDSRLTNVMKLVRSVEMYLAGG